MNSSSYKTHRILTINDSCFHEAHEIYTHSFPLHEQRDILDLPAALIHPDFRYEIFLTETNKVSAILCYWMTPEFIYLEHFAVNPQMRNLGLGKIILDSLKNKSRLPVILEIDPIVDEISRRRLGFYNRSGFVANEQFDYIHPPYSAGGESYPLLVMSFPEKLEGSLYRRFETYHHTTVIDPRS